MGILKNIWGSISAAVTAPAPKQSGSQLPPQPPPKAKPKQASIPPYYPTATPSETALLIRRELNLASSDILNLRLGATAAATLRDFAIASPDLSAALNANLRIGIPEGYKLKAWNTDGTFNPDATRLAYQIVQRMDMIPDYTEGFNTVNSLLATSEALGRDLLTTGSMAMELVLDKSRLPQKFVPLATAQIIFYPDVSGKSVIPTQRIAGQYIPLDIPTFFYVSVDQDLLSAYSNSPFEAAIQPVIADAEFTNDMRRVVKRSVHPRLDVSIDQDELTKATPPEILNDPEKLAEYRNAVQAAIGVTINGMAPEDALIHYDFVKVSYVDGGNHAPQDVFKGVQSLIDAKLSTGAKTLPSVLGHGSGSQNVASSETLLAMKTADGLVRRKLNELYSKGFTLAVRLFGLDVSIDFRYDDIELRPSGELEAFRSQKQSRVLEQLSFGMLSDEEACLELTGSLPPPGMTPLSGTRFSEGLGRGGAENPYSNAPAGGGSGSGSGGGPMNQTLKPDTPTGTRGKKN